MDFRANFHASGVPEQSQSLSSQVMDFVRDSVQSGEMDTESWYSVYQLAEMLKISRSPVREGLLRLEEAGLIEFVRNRGFRIIKTKPEEVSEIFALRLAIEPAATSRAAKLRTPEQIEDMNKLLSLMVQASEKADEAAFFHWDQLLHEQVLAAGRSKRGAKILAQLRAHTRILSTSTVRQYRTLEQVHSEHVPIIQAIESQDSALAFTTMSEHITATGKLLLRQAIAANRSQSNHPDDSSELPSLESEVERIWNLFA